MRYVGLAVVVLALAGVSGAWSADVAFEALDGRVTFSAPDSWRSGAQIGGDASETYGFQVPNPIDVESAHPTNVSVTCEILEDEPDIKSYGSGKLLRANLPGTVLVAETDHGDNGRGILQRGLIEGTTYILMHQVVRSGTVYVHVKAAYPVLAKNTKVWEETLRSDVNRLFFRVRIDGKDPFAEAADPSP